MAVRDSGGVGTCAVWGWSVGRTVYGEERG